jgi:hypothetical protein
MPGCKVSTDIDIQPDELLYDYEHWNWPAKYSFSTWTTNVEWHFQIGSMMGLQKYLKLLSHWKARNMYKAWRAQGCQPIE